MTTVLAQPDPPASDPDKVSEILCLGKYNIHVGGPLATLTFSHARPKAELLFNNGQMDFESIVRARIVIPAESLPGLRDLIDRLIKEQVATSIQGTAGKPN